MQTESSPESESRPRLLFVDDEQRVLNSMRIMFRRSFDLFLASQGSDALDIIKKEQIDVIVADHRMPRMTGVEVLSQVRQLSPHTIRILLTGYADLDAIEGSINESEVFRFLTKPCAPQHLRDTIELAAKLAKTTQGDWDQEVDEEIVDLMLDTDAEGPQPIRVSADVPTLQPSVDSVDGRIGDTAHLETLGEEEVDPLAATVVEPRPTVVEIPARKQDLGVLAFSSDDEMLATIERSVYGRVPVYTATNIVKVIQLLNEHRPGVLITDISSDKAAIQSMTAKLKEQLPELVTVAVSEHRDVLDMVWLINHGQIFRFLRKPLSPGRCAVSLQAALQHHKKLLRHPELCQLHQVDATQDTSLIDGVIGKIKGMKRLWSTL